MIDKQLQEYRNYQRLLKILLTYCGCWYMPTKSDKPTYCWSLCTILTMIMYLVLTLHLSYVSRHNLALMMKGMGVATSAISAILKIGSFLINRDSLINYHLTLSDIFEKELKQNEKIRAIMFSSLRLTLRLGYIYFAFLTGVLLAYFAPQYIFIIRHLFHFHLTANYTLNLSQGYFWTVPNNYLYHLHLLFETSLVMISSITASSIDSVFGFYVYQFASTMRAITFRLTNPLPSDKFSDVLRTCVMKHQTLLRCRDVLEHVYRPIILWHVISNALLLCSLIYDVMPFSDFEASVVFPFLTYFAVKLLQTFMYSFYGTIITSAGEDFRKGVYFGEWPNTDLDCHTRTNVILIMMQKSMTINAFFIPVDIVMFTNFLNTTISYFFLLQSVGNKG